jgi:hypothetical protein
MATVEEDEQTLNARLCIRHTRLQTFTATPPSLKPGDDATTLTWDVNLSPICQGASVLLNSQQVPANGSKSVEQSAGATYTLKVRMRSIEKVLGTITVPYDMSSCETWPVSEFLVQPLVAEKIKEMVDAIDRVSLRSDPTVEVLSGGLKFAVRARRDINNAPDLNIDIDAAINISVENGAPRVHFRSFSIDLDFDGWVAIVTLGMSKALEEVGEALAESKIKAAIGSALEPFISAAAAQFSNKTLHSITFHDIEMRVTFCGEEENAPDIFEPPTDVFEPR